MHVFIHKNSSSEINIYNFSETELTGTFFTKKRPEVGDVIMSHTRREPSFLYAYVVEGIKENRDARIQRECTYDPQNSFFVLSVRNATLDKEFVDFDNSVKSNL